jgi:hypothetical protein
MLVCLRKYTSYAVLRQPPGCSIGSNEVPCKRYSLYPPIRHVWPKGMAILASPLAASCKIFVDCDRWRGLAPGLVWLAVDEDMVSGTWTFDAQMKL